MTRDIIQLDITIFILLIPVELVWLVFGEQKKLMILLNINETKSYLKFLQCWVIFLIWCPLRILTKYPVVCLVVNKIMLTLDTCYNIIKMSLLTANLVCLLCANVLLQRLHNYLLLNQLAHGLPG